MNSRLKWLLEEVAGFITDLIFAAGVIFIFLILYALSYAVLPASKMIP